MSTAYAKRGSATLLTFPSPTSFEDLFVQSIEAKGVFNAPTSHLKTLRG